MKRLFSPIDVQVEITALCNQKCRHCYNYWRHRDVPKTDEMSSAQLKSVLTGLARAQVAEITFTGGEPLLRPDILVTSMFEASQLGLGFGLNSTAVMATDEIAFELSRVGLRHALVSILGPPAIHYMIGGGAASFDMAMAGIASLMRHGIAVSTNMVVSKLNLEHLFETAQLLRSSGIQAFCAGPMIPSCNENISMCLNAEECKQFLHTLIRIERELGLNIDILEPLPRCMFDSEDDAAFARFFGNRACSAGVSSCAISSSGSVRPCIHSDVIFGNVLHEDFLEIWQKMSGWSDVGILPERCRSCLAVNVCEGGCRMSAKVTSGRYDGPDMYMAEPIIDPHRACMLESREKDCREPLSADDTLNINGRCVIRQESDSVLICANNRFERMSSEGLDLISLLRGKRDFTATEVASDLGCDLEEVVQVFERLSVSGILLKSNRKGN